MDRSQILPPRKSAEIVASRAQHVSIKKNGVDFLAQKICEKLEDATISIDMFSKHDLHPDPLDPATIDWIFVVDTLNFCFWSSDAAHYAVTYKGKQYTGYFALCAAINRAKDEGKAITNPHFYSTLSLKDVKELLRGDDGSAALSLMDERLQCLRQVGTCLIERFEGSFVNCVKACNGSAATLLNLIVSEFPCFRDEATYEGLHISFYKRAQILIGDVWACFKGEGQGYFADIDGLTMFADYRVPQVLVYFGVLEYSPYLRGVLDSGTILDNCSQEEIEIRGCSIHAVELICTEVRSLLGRASKASLFHVNPILIDHFLWDFRREHAQYLNHIPFHKVVSIFY